MAQFNAEGIEGLDLSFQEFAEIPDEVVEDMLDAAAEVTVAAHKRSIQTLGLVDTGKLKDSIKAVKKVGSQDGHQQKYVLVYPSGKHGNSRRKRGGKRKKQGRAHAVNVTNGEVGFIHEFGAPRKGIPAKMWMKKANETCAADVEAAEMAVYEQYLNSLNL